MNLKTSTKKSKILKISKKKSKTELKSKPPLLQQQQKQVSKA